MKEYRQKIEYYFKQITAEKKEKFERFRALLLEYNQKYNLTAITEEREVTYKHFLDSLMGEEYFPLNSQVVEVGSGAGFPSIPLKILRDDLQFSLIESTGKKCDFLRVVVDNLGLNEVTVYNLRAEEAGKSVQMREKFDVCCARAVARLNTLAEYCLPLVKVGGKMVAYKGRADEEIFEGQTACSLLGGGKIKAYSYELTEEMGQRSLVVVDKIKNTPQKYPRGNGKERSKPIV